MKKTMATLAVAGVATIATAAYADVLLLEDFEDSSVSYTTAPAAEFTDNSGDFFTRSDGSNIGTFVVYNGKQGDYFFAAMDLDGDGNAAVQSLTFSGINIASYSDLTFSGLFAEDDDGANQDIDVPDYVKIEYRIDGGAYQNLLWFSGADFTSGGQFNGVFRDDTDFNGVGDGAEVTSTFSNFTKAITGTGSLLDLRITIAVEAGDEDIAFDNIAITGVVPEPASLALAGLGGLTLLARRRTA